MAAGVTLIANFGTILGGAAAEGYLRITLCGYGPVLPCVPGNKMIADAGIPTFLGPANTFSQLLWGNDSIVPANTFYEIAMLDSKKNVIQSGIYQFANSDGDVDLSDATQIVAPFGFQLPALAGRPCTGTVPGNVYTAPGRPIAVFYNGAYLPPGQSFPLLSYTAAGEVITLNFSTEVEDRIDALCIL